MTAPVKVALTDNEAPVNDQGRWNPGFRRVIEALVKWYNRVTEFGDSLATAASKDDARALLSVELTDNTSDADKPVSDATQAAVDALEAATAAGFQPLDSDLTAIAALSTTAFGRALLELASAAATRAALDLEAGTDFYSITAADAAFQPKDSDLTALAALTTTAFGRALIELADAAALRTAAALGTIAQQNSPLVLLQGGTGATTAAGARSAILLGLETLNSDATSNFSPAVNGFVTLETTTLTANRNRNLQTTGAVAGDIYEYRRTSADAFGRQIRNSAAANLGAAVAINITARFVFNGTEWENFGRSAS